MRLIDADVIKKKMEPCKNIAESITDYEQGYLDSRNVMIDMIGNSPTIEAEPVLHGRWQWANGYIGTMAECSVCGLSPMGFYSLPINQIGRLPEYKYCPHCGAKMDGGL